MKPENEVSEPMKRTRRITVETEQMLIIKQTDNLLASVLEDWCPVCGERVQMMSFETAAATMGLRHRVLYRLVEAGGLHFQETADGLLWICPNSLPIPINQGENL